MTAVAGERTGGRLRRELLGVADSLRVGRTPPVTVVVHPPPGRPWTRFRLELVSFQRTACVIQNEGWFSHGRQGARLRAVLDPTRTKGRRWCLGRFRGVVKCRGAICGRERCHRVHIRRVGRFAFTVR